MDIKINTDKLNFTYRVAGLILCENKILVQKNCSFDYVTLPGGKCMINESSGSALEREIKEEMNLTVKNIKTKAIMENFFYSEFDKKDRHELLFINEVMLISKVDFTKKIINLENKYGDEQYFEWVQISELDNLDIKPNLIKNIVNCNKLIHVVVDERKSL